MKRLPPRKRMKQKVEQKSYPSWVVSFDRETNFTFGSGSTIVSKVVGVSFMDPSSGLSRQTLLKEIAEFMHEFSEIKVAIALEHVANEYDNSAIRVYVDNGEKEYWVGFLPKGLSTKIAPEIARYKVEDFAILGTARRGIQLKIVKGNIEEIEEEILAPLRWASAFEARKALRRK